MELKVKRVYLAKEKSDGFRVLVDRLWPRGLSKEKAALDLWAKDIAPSEELRKWFNHESEKWPEFQRRYKAELAENPQILDEFRQALKGHPVITLLFGAKDETRNQAVVLQTVLAARATPNSLR